MTTSTSHLAKRRDIDILNNLAHLESAELRMLYILVRVYY